MRKTILPVNVNVVIEGRTLIIKPISRKEINEVYISWINNPEINKYLDARYKKQSVNDIVDNINKLRSKSGCELFAIFTKKRHAHIGNISIIEHNPDNQGYAIYGIMVGDRGARMLGLGGEATVLMIEYLFRDPDIRRIQGGTVADNYNSCDVFETLGFKREAILRKHSVLTSGKICDFYIYGMLREEWIINCSRVLSLLRDIKVMEYSEGNSI